jgi:hypothetical protein
MFARMNKIEARIQSPYEEHACHRKNAQRQKTAEHLFFATLQVGNRSQHGRQQCDDDHASHSGC